MSIHHLLFDNVTKHAYKIKIENWKKIKISLILHLLFINICMRMYVQFVNWTYFFVYLHIYCCQKTKILRTFISCFNCVIFFQTDHLKVDWMELCNNLEYRLCKKNYKLVFKCYFEKNIFYYITILKKMFKIIILTNMHIYYLAALFFYKNFSLIKKMH